MKVAFSSLADKQIRALPNHISDRIVAKMEWYASQPLPLIFAKRLSGDLSDYFRFRIGEYRVIVLPTGIILSVIRVEKRSEAYR